MPGLLDWSTMTHNPFVEVTKDTTTLYASDLGVFLFLVDDAHPIETGRLPNGEPDLYFRDFYCWNSEVGSKTLGMASYYLLAVCKNRNIWGAEGFEEISIRHNKFASHPFAYQAAPARIAARWADHRKLPQVAFKPDWTKHAKAAPFKGNDQMLEVLPIGAMAFPGTGIQQNLADKAKKLGIPVWKFGSA